MKNLNKKTALITGAGSGIGEQIALALAAKGCHVVVTDINIDNAERVAGDLRSRGTEAIALALDVADYDAFESVAEQAIAWKGCVDILVNNAGFMIGGSVSEIDMPMWHKITDVNVFGVVNGVKAFEQHMKRRGEGHIVNVASLFGLLHLPYVSTYAMTKAAVVGLTNALHGEMAAYGVGVTLVCPGSVSTKLVDNGSWADSKGGNFIPEMFAKYHTSDAVDIAAQIVKGIEKNKAQVMAGNDAKLISRLVRWVPGLFRWSSQKLGRELADQ
ncbi:Putative oxidoreductase SadH [BD1-7 clade bacterium]|uniref:Oxidoreductase SadH n=1 Tax=BD1-7 clade bacterium TaxID=2029982 RepID=A0A5S9QDN7_9GAMM|nr:Putative oxidoreductase SadH [BD1-7 clade bacterium]CAA0116482.1 Putative oxidoreductase SadH [BD1-7 clade bacterium]